MCHEIVKLLAWMKRNGITPCRPLIRDAAKGSTQNKGQYICWLPPRPHSLVHTHTDTLTRRLHITALPLVVLCLRCTSAHTYTQAHTNLKCDARKARNRPRPQRCEAGAVPSGATRAHASHIHRQRARENGETGRKGGTGRRACAMMSCCGRFGRLGLRREAVDALPDDVHAECKCAVLQTGKRLLPQVLEGGVVAPSVLAAKHHGNRGGCGGVLLVRLRGRISATTASIGLGIFVMNRKSHG